MISYDRDIKLYESNQKELYTLNSKISRGKSKIVVVLDNLLKL